MTADTSTPPGETATTRLVFALEWLFTMDQRWRPVPSPVGATIALMRCWQDTTADTVVMSPETTYAVRADSRGQQVERVEGTAALVVSAVCSWPVPAFGRVPAVSGVRP